MPAYTVKAPDGKTYDVNAPDGATQEDAIAYVQKNFYSEQPKESSNGVGQALGNIGAGILRGAGSIGSTILLPADMINQKLRGEDFFSMKDNQARRQSIDEGLQAMGAQPDSLAYKGGKIAGEIAGTAGAPGVLAKGAQGLGATPSIVRALGSGGLSGANLPTRMGAGALAGGASAGLVNPEDAGLGAMIGGAIPPALSLAKGAGTGVRKILGQTTGVGDEALSQAVQAGRAGGPQAQAFRENLRGQADMGDVLASAKQNLDVMGQQKQAAYRSGMSNIKNDKTVLNFSDIDNALNDAMNVASYKGQIKNQEAANALGKISQQVKDWKSLNPAEFHTPEGLDALKQSISGVLESIPFEQRTARLATGKVYDAVKGTINKQAPEYAKVMKDYSEASDLIREIEKSLIGNNKATAESSMRKLQSLMRNNVNTSYGFRTGLAKELEQAGGQQIMPALAGQALNEWTPRGLQRATGGAGVGIAAAMGNLPAAAVMGATSSPRLMGEAAYGLGRMAGLTPQPAVDVMRQGLLAAPVIGSQLDM